MCSIKDEQLTSKLFKTNVWNENENVRESLVYENKVMMLAASQQSSGKSPGSRLHGGNSSTAYVDAVAE